MIHAALPAASIDEQAKAFPMSDTLTLARRNMVETQLKTNGIHNTALLEVMERIPRDIFLPAKMKSRAYIDEDILFPGGFLIEPLALAKLIQTLDPSPDATILVLGDFTGYVSAILSDLCGSVISCVPGDADKDLLIKRYNQLGISNVDIVEAGDHEKILDRYGQFQGIIFAGALSKKPKAFYCRLAKDCHLVFILREEPRSEGRIILTECIEENKYSDTTEAGASTPYLHEYCPAECFSF